MGNRIIRESLRRSPQIDALSWFEEVVFCRMITAADDYGCMDGRTLVLIHDLFPTKENVSKEQMQQAVQRLVELDLLRAYEVDGTPYLRLTTWDKHQYVRRKKIKCPLPTDGSVTAETPDGPMRAGAESVTQNKSKKESVTLRAHAQEYIQHDYAAAELLKLFVDLDRGERCS